MAPLRLIREAGRMVGQGQRLANRGQAEFSRASEELARTPSGAINPKHWVNKLDSGVDFVEVNLLERVERYAWLSCRTGLALGALVGSAYGMKYTFEELWSPRPFGHFLSSEAGNDATSDDSFSQTVEKPILTYAQVKALAIEVNGKYLKELIGGMKEAAIEGLLNTFISDVLLRHEKFLETKPLTVDQRAEVMSTFMSAAIKEVNKFNLLIKNNVHTSGGDNNNQS